MTNEIDNSPTTHDLRCAIYTRTATIVEAERFNSIQYQRKAAESFIAERAGSGWVLLPDRYDDEGFSGSTVDRPGLKQLLQDVRDGRIDCVVVNSLDRLSRNMNDMSEIMFTLTANEVSLTTVMEQPVLDKQIRFVEGVLGSVR